MGKYVFYLFFLIFRRFYRSVLKRNIEKNSLWKWGNRKFAQNIHKLTAKFLIEYVIFPLEIKQKVISNCVCSFFSPPPQKHYIEKRDFDSILQYAWIDFRVKEKHIVGEGWWRWRGCGLWWRLPSGSFQNDLSGMGKYFLPPTII